MGPPYGSTPGERATMARSLALLFGSGGVLVLLSLLVADPTGRRALGIAVPGVLALLTAGVLLAFGRAFGSTAFQAWLALGALLIGVCVAAGGQSAGAYAFMYAWVALFAASFFSSSAAAAQLGLCVVLDAVALLVATDVGDRTSSWLMSSGAVVVGGLLVSRLTQAIRAQSADLAAVTQMASGLSDVQALAQAACESLRASTRADAVILLEPSPDADGLRVTAMSGASEAGMAFNAERVLREIQRAYESTEPVVLTGDPSRRLAGQVTGLAQPVVREGRTAAVLALAWTTQRRTLPERAQSAARLFAAEVSVALDQAELRGQDRRRQALEINDNIVQGLVVAKYLVQSGKAEESLGALDETLGRARKLITDQLHEVSRGPGLRPGDLARAEASSVSAPAPDGPSPPPASPSRR